VQTPLFAIVDGEIRAGDDRQAGDDSFGGDSFLGDAENQWVRHVSVRIAGGDLPPSPLVFCGPASCGKSLLLRCLGDLYRRKHPRATVTQYAAADFARACGSASVTSSAEDFLEKLTAADLLLIDDTHRLAGRPTAQRMLSVVLDERVSHGAATFFTMERLPSKTAKLSASLGGRLMAGLTVPMSPPGPEVRELVLMRIAARRDFQLQQEAAQMLARRWNESATGLEERLARLAGQCYGPIDVESARRYLQAKSSASKRTLSQIARTTARYFQLSLEQLTGPSRRQGIVFARSIAMVIMRRTTPASLQQVGQYFGGRDHTTVIHACRKIEEKLNKDAHTQRCVRELTEALNTEATTKRKKG